MHILLIFGALCAAVMLGVSYATNFLSLKDRLDILSGRKSPQATKADTDALAEALARQSELIKELEGKSVRGPEYVDGLPETLNKTLKAAYQEARILQLEGYRAQSAEKHREAIDRFTRALTLAETDSQRAALHILRGNSHFKISRYGEAEMDLQETLRLAENVSPTAEAAHIRMAAWANLGSVYADQGELDKAEQSDMRALGIARARGDRASEIKILGKLGTVCAQRGLFVEAEGHTETALRAARESGDRREEAIQLGNLGNIDLLRGETDKARERLERVLEMQVEAGDRSGQENTLMSLGSVLLQSWRLRGAEMCYEHVVAVAKETGDRRSLALALGNLGLVYRRLGDFDGSRAYHEGALGLHREVGDRLGEADQLVNLALLLLGQLDFPAVRDYLGKATVIYDDNHVVGQRRSAVKETLEKVAELERQPWVVKRLQDRGRATGSPPDD